MSDALPEAPREAGWKELFIVLACAWGLVGIPSSVVGTMLILDDAMRLGEELARSGKPVELEVIVKEVTALTFEMLASPVILVVSMLTDAVVSIGAVWLFGCKLLGRTFASGLSLLRSRWTIPVATGGLVLAVLSHVLPFDEGKTSLDVMLENPAVFWVFMPLALVAAVVEEIYYRGFLLPILTRKLGAVAGIAIVTIWFGSIHIVQYLPQWDVIAWIFLIGFVLTMLRHFSRSLVPSIAFHLAYNGTLVALTIYGRIG